MSRVEVEAVEPWGADAWGQDQFGPELAQDRSVRMYSSRIELRICRRGPSLTLYCPAVCVLVFCQTETWLVLSPVKGSRFQSAHRSRKVIPASRAMRSNSDGHT